MRVGRWAGHTRPDASRKFSHTVRHSPSISMGIPSGGSRFSAPEIGLMRDLPSLRRLACFSSDDKWQLILSDTIDSCATRLIELGSSNANAAAGANRSGGPFRHQQLFQHARCGSAPNVLVASGSRELDDGADELAQFGFAFPPPLLTVGNPHEHRVTRFR
jgi:hypothetical protein